MLRHLVSPPFFFLFGSFVYMVIPWAMYHLNYLNVSFLIRATSQHIENGYIYDGLLLDFIVMNFSFTLGYIFSTRLNFRRSKTIFSLDNFGISKCIIFFTLASVFALSSLRIIQAGIIPFLGYQFKPELLGPLATVCFTTMWFYHYTSDKKFIILFLLSSFWLIGLGSRMFVFLPILSLLILSIYEYPKRSVRYFIIASCLVVFFVMVGVVRQGWDLNIQNFIAIIAAEPIFTSLGSLYYLNTGRDLVNIPFDIFASVINFVPSLIFPDKTELMASIMDSNSRIYNPIGAQALIVSLYHNFGMLYPLFLISIGFYFGFLLKNIHNVFCKAVYFSSLPFLLVHFHREGFVTFFKVVVFNSFIFPLLLIFTLRFILSEKKNK